MSVFYVDTSAIAKRYIAEIGSAWIQSLVKPSVGHTLVVCELTPIEFVSILARQQREGRMTPATVRHIEIAYQRHHAQRYSVTPFDRNVRGLARALVYRHILRALDAIHLTSALEAERIIGAPLTFLTSDKHLLSAAAGEGLLTDNPLNHP